MEGDLQDRSLLPPGDLRLPAAQGLTGLARTALNVANPSLQRYLEGLAYGPCIACACGCDDWRIGWQLASLPSAVGPLYAACLVEGVEYIGNVSFRPGT